MLSTSLVSRSSRALRGARLLTSAVAAGAILLAGARDLHAQAKMRFDYTGTTVGFQASNLAPSGADVGPSYATILQGVPALPGQNQSLIVYCVDISNDALYGQIWDAWITPLGGTPNGTTPDLSQTRQGAIDSDPLAHYRKAAWLIDQYESNPTQTAGIQGAIWMQFKTSLFPFGASAAEQTSLDSWLAAANAFEQSGAYETYDYSRFVIITDTTAVGKDWGGAQEFMARVQGVSAVPEPSELALLGTGLLTMGGLTWRRRRNGRGNVQS